MPYVKDENNNYIFDEYGKNIEYTVEYIENGDWVYKHKEPLYINDDGHLDTEDRNISIKDGIKYNHAVSKKQIDQLDTDIKEYIDNKISALQNLINISIKNLLEAQETKILAQMLSFRNDQIKHRIGRKKVNIPKKNHTWIKLIDKNDIPHDITDLSEVIIMNVFISRFDRYHHSKSALVESAFSNQLEFFYSHDFEGYYMYFPSHDSKWGMNAIIEYIIIPKPIDIESIVPSNDYIPDNKPEASLNSNDANR